MLLLPDFVLHASLARLIITGRIAFGDGSLLSPSCFTGLLTQAHYAEAAGDD